MSETVPAEFDDILQLQKQGKTTEALESCRKLLELHPRNPTLHQFAAMIYCQGGNFKDGIHHLEQTIMNGMDTPAMRFNLIKALFEMGELAGARRECEALISREGNYEKFLCTYADILKAQGELDHAQATYQQVLTANQDNLHAWNNLGNMLHDMGRFDHAAIALKNAVRLAPQSVETLINLGMALGKGGQAEQALVPLGRACDLDPDNLLALEALGELMINLGRQVDTVQIYERVTRLAPANPAGFFSYGTALAYNSKPVEAIAAYREAIRLKPDMWTAHINLISQLEKTNQLEEMDNVLKVVEEAGVDHPSLPVFRATILKRRGEFAAAREILERTDTSGELSTDVMHSALLGQVLDRLDEPAAAFDAFNRMNRLEASKPYALRYDKNTYLSRLQVLKQLYEGTVATGRHPESGTASGDSLVFMVGFPRSGTTLLDTMLRGHDAIGVLEEVPIIDNIIDRYGRSAAYAEQAPERLEQFRQQYFVDMEEHKSDRGKTVWIDKLPLNMGEAGFIHRLFPAAKFILVLRHPCDCVLSCFMQQFALNDAMANFATIEDSANLYNEVMSLWQVYCDKLPLEVHTVKYEDVIADTRGTIEPLLSYLGVPWSDNILDYRKTAASRENINTPSYSQVTEKLYSTAAGRWTRYADQMEGVLPVLAPWIEKFDYA